MNGLMMGLVTGGPTLMVEVILLYSVLNLTIQSVIQLYGADRTIIHGIKKPDADYAGLAPSAATS